MTTENKLEELLNKLIKLGRKPRGITWKIWISTESTVSLYDKIPNVVVYKWTTISWPWNTSFLKFGSLRDLVSLESGLRQFVCDGWLLIRKTKRALKLVKWSTYCFARWHHTPEYRLMLISIQTNLVNFLLSNITTEWVTQSPSN